MSQLPLSLSDCVPIVVAAAAVFWLHLEGRTCHGDKGVDRGRANIVDAAKGLLSETNKQIRQGLRL